MSVEIFWITDAVIVECCKFGLSETDQGQSREQVGLLLSLLPLESHARTPQLSTSNFQPNSFMVSCSHANIYFRLNNNFSSLVCVSLMYTDSNYSLFTNVFLLDPVNSALAVPSPKGFIFQGTLSVLSSSAHERLGPCAVFPMKLHRCFAQDIAFTYSAGNGSPDANLNSISLYFPFSWSTTWVFISNLVCL